jgi:magnesium-transporting ATPase (P-type)
MNLDGETNLKERTAIDLTKNIKTNTQLSELHGDISADMPNISLTRWNCNIRFAGGEWEFLGLNQLLLRGCVLKNTDYAIGIAIYTGHESKVMLNSKAAPTKTSNVLLRMNKMLYTVFLFLICICFIFAAASMSWQVRNADDHNYLDLKSDPNFGDYLIQVLTFLVAFSHMIPISLYVALEIVKLALAYLVKNDIELYYEEDDKPANVRTSDLIEELG